MDCACKQCYKICFLLSLPVPDPFKWFGSFLAFLLYLLSTSYVHETGLSALGLEVRGERSYDPWFLLSQILEYRKGITHISVKWHLKAICNFSREWCKGSFLAKHLKSPLRQMYPYQGTCVQCQIGLFTLASWWRHDGGSGVWVPAVHKGDMSEFLYPSFRPISRSI